MTKFFYEAKKNPQEFVRDVLEAEHLEEAIKKITALGYVPLKVTPYLPAAKKNAFQSRKKTISFGASVPKSQIVNFTRQLFDLIDSGIPLLRALGITAHQAKYPRFKEMLNQIYALVQGGASFSEALLHYQDAFSMLYINMIKSGEMSGNLVLILERLSSFLENDEEWRSQVKSSLIYPCLILIVGIGTIFVLLTFVIPRLTDMFQDLSARLPFPTMLLIFISDFFARFWGLMIVGACLLGLLFKRYSLSETGKSQIDRMTLKVPLVGSFVQHSEIARFSRTLSTLLSSGVAIVPALESTSAVLDNAILKTEARKILKCVSAGSSLTESIKLSGFFPDLASSMVAIGEESGRLDTALLKLAISYEKKTESMMKVLTSLLEPLLIAGVGIIIGFVVISMLLPIFQINFVIQ